MQEQQKLREELERRILYGLACEWEYAVASLDPDVQDSIRKPLFRLSDMKKRLGSWSDSRREICLSRNLVFHHPWDSVKDVLLHEMAHQYASEVLKAGYESPHGAAFQQACRLLRAHPGASGTYQTLHEQIEKGAATRDDRILLKINKLMSLSASSNPHEAEAAMIKSRELIQKYNIELFQKSNISDYNSIFLGTPKLRHFREAYHLANLITGYYFVAGVWIPAFVISKGKMGKVLEISGTPRNLKIAEYVYLFIRQYIDLEWCRYRSGTAYTRYHKTDFSIGIIEGFRKKLRHRKMKKKEDDSQAVVPVTDPNLKKYIDYKYSVLRNITRSGNCRSGKVAADGYALGGKLIVFKGISEKKNRVGGLLD